MVRKSSLLAVKINLMQEKCQPGVFAFKDLLNQNFFNQFCVLFYFKVYLINKNNHFLNEF